MKYCFNYIEKDMKYLEEVDEITIMFRASDTSLVDFMQEHSYQRFNIAIVDPMDFIENNRIKLFDAIADEHPDLEFVFKIMDNCNSDDENLPANKILKIIQEDERDFKYFFAYFARDWDIFYGLLELHPSDIYVTEDLGFNIKKCADVAHAAETQIRVFPNVAQSSWYSTPAMKKFFIRPEDMKFYEPYVDVCEFFTYKENKQSTYYRIYTKDEAKWFGNLKEMIISLNEDIDSRCLLPTFAEKRLNCGRRCLSGRTCRVCDATNELAQVLSERQLLVKDLEKRRQKHKTKVAD